MARVLMAGRCLGTFAVLLGSLMSVGTAAELVWPLPDGQELTSGFGEHRSSHFHGGIDVRTQGKELACVAVDDGWVERIAVSPTGYGRTVYLHLPDGRTAVYAHLSRFARDIESVLRAKQLEIGIYRVDFPLERGELSFERGETIGWTGSSGVGAPHLHFELREGAVQIDPFFEYRRNDTQRPLVYGLRIVEVSDERAGRYSSGSDILLEKVAGDFRGYARVPSGVPFVLLLKARDPLPFGQHRPWTRCVLWQEQTHDTLADVRREGIDLLAQPTLWASVDYPGWRYDGAEWWRLHAGEVGDFRPFRALADEVEDFVLDVYDAAHNRARVRLQLTPQARQASVHEGVPSGAAEVSGQGTGGFRLALDPREKSPPLELAVGGAESEVSLQPDRLGLYYKATLSYQESDERAKRGAYLYEMRNGDKRFLSAAWDRSGARLTAKIVCTGTYGVARDTTAPTLSLWVASGDLFFKARDEESGIDDRSVQCRVDEQTAIAEYEPEEEGGLIWTPFELKPGEHKVALHAKDRVGNEAVLEKTVTVR
jgi:hypothetical protein